MSNRTDAPPPEDEAAADETLESGSPSAKGRLENTDDLTTQLYAVLREFAERQLRAERADHTLQATAVVHEAYLRLADQRSEWANREQFLALAARTMRRVLVDHARRHQAQRRGGHLERVPLTLQGILGQPMVEVLHMEELFAQLEAKAPRKARLAELHLFGGLNITECAHALRVSRRTAVDDWAFARAWLKRELAKAPSD